METEFLFQADTNRQVESIIKVLFEQLKQNQESYVRIGSNNLILAVKLSRSVIKKVQFIEEYHVPSFRFDTIDLSVLPWDVSFQHLLPQIDGISNVKRIARQANMDVSVAKHCLELLAFQDCVFITDAMRFSNMYSLNGDVAAQMFADNAAMDEMRAFCAQGSGAVIPSTEQLIDLLVAFQPGRKVRDVLLDVIDHRQGKSNNPKSHALSLAGVNISKVLIFAQAHGILRRLHEYPISLKTSALPSSHRSIDEIAIGNTSEDKGPSIGAVKMMASPHRPSLLRTLEEQLSDSDAESKPQALKQKTLSFFEGTKSGGEMFINLAIDASAHFFLGIMHSPAKLTRAKSIIGRNYLKGIDNDDLDSARGQTSLAQGNMKSSSESRRSYSMSEVVNLLTGELPLDAICCKYNLYPQDILRHEGVRVIYK